MNAWHHLKAGWAPIAAVVAATAAALYGSGHGAMPATAAPATAETVNSVPAPPGGWEPFISDSDSPSPMAAPDDEASPALSGEVLEEIDVGKYSYLHVKDGDQPPFWAAVAKTTGKLGQHVTVENAQLMTNFVSATLKRTFEAIYFGALGEETASPTTLALQQSPDKAGPHPGPGKEADGVPVGRLARAAGPLGHTVAELNHAPPALTGKKAHVRGVVVKRTLGVLGHTFLHVRDGSGEAADGSNDLTVTSTAEPAVGTEVLLEGTLERDRDFGSGYVYRVLLADATLVGN